MHELITAVGALIVISLFISQFAASENLFIEAVTVERTVNAYLEKEYDESETEEKLGELCHDISEIPNVRGSIKGDRLVIRIDNVIGPAGALGISDNSIELEKEIKLRIREEDSDEEHDDDSGTPDIDGASWQIPASDESSGAFDDIEGEDPA